MSEPRSTTREYLEALLIAAIFLGFTNTFVLKTFYIPSSSMENTMLVGDHLFVNRFIYGTPRYAWEETLFPTRRWVARRSPSWDSIEPPYGTTLQLRSPSDGDERLVRREVVNLSTYR